MYPFESTTIPVPTPSDSVGIENILFELITVVVIPTTDGIAFSVTAWYTFVLFPALLILILCDVAPPFDDEVKLFFNKTTVKNELSTEHITATITTNPIPFFLDIFSPPNKMNILLFYLYYLLLTFNLLNIKKKSSQSI